MRRHHPYVKQLQLQYDFYYNEQQQTTKQQMTIVFLG